MEEAENRERYAGLGRVLMALRDLYDVQDAYAWLGAPQKVLGGRRAIDLIAEGRAEEVVRPILQLLEGAYT